MKYNGTDRNDNAYKQYCAANFDGTPCSHNAYYGDDVIIFEKVLRRGVSIDTPGETENEWQKTEPVPILLLRGARSFFDAKKNEKKILLAWTFPILDHF